MTDQQIIDMVIERVDAQVLKDQNVLDGTGRKRPTVLLYAYESYEVIETRSYRNGPESSAWADKSSTFTLTKKEVPHA